MRGPDDGYAPLLMSFESSNTAGAHDGEAEEECVRYVYDLTVSVCAASPRES